MTYADFKDLDRSTFVDKILPDQAFNIGKHLKYDRYWRALSSMVWTFFDKKLLAEVLKMKLFQRKI